MKYVVLNHYNASRLLGVWVDQDPAPPIANYFAGSTREDRLYAEAVVLDKLEGQSWHDHLVAVSERTPSSDCWWVGEEIDAVLPPDPQLTADLMRAQDDRLHGR